MQPWNNGLDRESTERWSTSNSVYGNRLHPVRPALPKRPDNENVGVGPPYGNQNTALLSPRVSNNYLNPGSSPRHSMEPSLMCPKGSPRLLIPQQMRNAVLPPLLSDEAKKLIPSSTRDVTRNYSLMLHNALNGNQTTHYGSPRNRPSHRCEGFYALQLAPYVGPSRYGAEP